MSNTSSSTININHSDLVSETVMTHYYSQASLQKVLSATFEFIDKQQQAGLILPYYKDFKNEHWQQKAKELDVYVTDIDEAKQLNLDARGKDYATNILSYPSELPAFILEEMPTIPLGELIICHDVVVKQAEEQKKTVTNHAIHLLIHGILHLLGFDHELGDAEADEMEGFEIAIMKQLGLANPYEVK